MAVNVGGSRQYGYMGADQFSAATRAWFEGAFAEPTQAQLGAWEAISGGQDTLVVAPTGLALLRK